jgi:hypothetical protein
MHVHGGRHVERMQADGAHALEGIGDDRFVWNGTIGIRRRARRFGRVFPRLAVHAEQTFRFAIPGLEVGVAYRPRHGPALVMLDTFEVALAENETWRRRKTWYGRRRNRTVPAETACRRRHTKVSVVR